MSKKSKQEELRKRPLDPRPITAEDKADQTVLDWGWVKVRAGVMHSAYEIFHHYTDLINYLSPSDDYRTNYISGYHNIMNGKSDTHPVDYFTYDEVNAIHDRLAMNFGGMDISAADTEITNLVENIKNSDASVIEKAAYLFVESLCSKPFADRNAATAFVLMMTFLSINHVSLNTTPEILQQKIEPFFKGREVYFRKAHEELAWCLWEIIHC